MRAALIRGCSFTLEYTQIPNVLPETMLVVVVVHIWNFMFGSSAGRDTMRIRGAF